MGSNEQNPTGKHDHLLPDSPTINQLARNDFFYRYGYHRLELGRGILRKKIRSLTAMINFRIANPDLPQNETLLRSSLIERAIAEKVVTLGDITPFSELETEIFDKDTPSFPE